MRPLKASIICIIVAIATVLAVLAITYYFNLFNLVSPTKTSTPTSTPPVRATIIGPLRIDVLSIAETTYINLSLDGGFSFQCVKTIGGMKFVVISIKLTNVGSRGIGLDEIHQYFEGIALITNTGKAYNLPLLTYFTYTSPYWEQVPQEECARNNAITIRVPIKIMLTYELKPGEYLEDSNFFVIPQSEIPWVLVFIKDARIVATIKLCDINSLN